MTAIAEVFQRKTAGMISSKPRVNNERKAASTAAWSVCGFTLVTHIFEMGSVCWCSILFSSSEARIMPLSVWLSWEQITAGGEVGAIYRRTADGSDFDTGGRWLTCGVFCGCTSRGKSSKVFTLG